MRAASGQETQLGCKLRLSVGPTPGCTANLADGLPPYFTTMLSCCTYRLAKERLYIFDLVTHGHQASLLVVFACINIQFPRSGRKKLQTTEATDSTTDVGADSTGAAGGAASSNSVPEERQETQAL